MNLKLITTLAINIALIVVFCFFWAMYYGLSLEQIIQHPVFAIGWTVAMGQSIVIFMFFFYGDDDAIG